MRPFWKRDQSHTGLEDELRARRFHPPADFVRTLAGRVPGTGRRSRLKLSISPAYGVAIVAVAVLIAAGGVGLVRSAGSGTHHVLARLADSSSQQNTVTNSSGQDQYAGLCGTPPRSSLCVIKFNDSNVQIKEPSSGCVNAEFDVMRVSNTDQTLTVDYYTQDGTASTTDGDYVAEHGTLVFPAGAPGQTKQEINVPVCHDAGSASEYFYVYLTNPSPGATIGGTNPATGTIKQ